MRGPRLIETAFQVLHPIDGIKPMVAMLPATPSLEQLHEVIDPHIEGGRMEHVSVFYKGGIRDLFVDEDFQAKGLRYNVVATGIYRAGYMAQHPHVDPCGLGVHPWVGGAVPEQEGMVLAIRAAIRVWQLIASV